MISHTIRKVSCEASIDYDNYKDSQDQQNECREIDDSWLLPLKQVLPSTLFFLILQISTNLYFHSVIIPRIRDVYILVIASFTHCFLAELIQDGN